jgi:hypothetical protein
MRRRLVTITFVTLLILIATAGSLGAQGRGRGGFGPGNVGRGNRVGGPGAVVIPAPVPPRGVGVFSVPSRGVFFGSVPAPIVAPRAIGRFQAVRPQPRFFYPQQFVTYSPYSVIAPQIYTPPAYVAPTYVAPTYEAPSVTQNDVDLAYEVQRLSREIEQLRQQQALAAAQQALALPPLPPEPERPAIPTVLVFRDGSRRTIQNYAIIGQTLWILDEQTSTRIPLSELDLAATQQENRGQGLRFPIPQR